MYRLLKMNKGLSAKAPTFVPFEECQAEIRRLEARGGWLESKKDSFKEKLRKEKERTSTFHNKIQELIQKCARTESQVVESQKAYEESKSLREREATRYKEEIQVLDGRLERSETRLVQSDRRQQELQNEIHFLKREIREMPKADERWIVRTLKFKFLLNEIQKIGALPEDHAEWVFPMVEDIEIPEVSREIRNKVFPSESDAHMIYDSPEERETRLTEWSREASQFSDSLNENYAILINENPELARRFLTLIQSLIRGFITRRRIHFLYGINPIEKHEKMEASVMIQKIFRGYRYRGIVYTKVFDNSRTGMPIWNGRSSDRRGINLINTRGVDMDVSWIRRDGTYSSPISVMKYNPSTIGISTFITHYFVVRPKSPFRETPVATHVDDEIAVPQRFFKIPTFFKSGTVVDVATGLSFTKEHWMARKERADEGLPRDRKTSFWWTSDSESSYVESILDDVTDSGCQCPSCTRMRESDEGDPWTCASCTFINEEGGSQCEMCGGTERQSESNLQIAIQMSLESPNPESITDDIEDNGNVLSNMFPEEE